MSKMTVIQLLNKIANGEIEANTELYYKDEKYRHIDHLFGYYYVEEVLNDEVEIIEEDNKIEKVNEDKFNDLHNNTKIILLKNKINEIIDYINKENKE